MDPSPPSATLPRDSSLASDDTKHLARIPAFPHDVFSPTSTASSEDTSRSDSDTYYRDVADVVRDDSAWPAPVNRQTVEPTYDSQEEAAVDTYLAVIELSDEHEDTEHHVHLSAASVEADDDDRQLPVVEISDEDDVTPAMDNAHTTSPRIEKAAYAEASEALAAEARQRKEAELEAHKLLSGEGKHKRHFSDWAVAADEALSLEELQLEADQIAAAIEQRYGDGLVRVGRGRGCTTAAAVRKRVENVVNSLAEMQIVTAGIAANAEGELAGEKDVLRSEVYRLRMLLDHIVKLMLEKAYQVRDCAERHR